MGAILDKVVGPDVIAVLWPQSDAGSVIEPQPPAFRLLLGNLQSLTPPDPLDPLVTHQPTRIPQQSGDLAIAITAVKMSQFDDVGGQPLFVFTAPRCLALCRAMLAECRASATLGDMQFMSDMLDTGSATRGA
jgi:hypothetical protein